MFDIQPSQLTDEEFVRYAQFFHDRKELLPLAWQEQLLKRLIAQLDAVDLTI